LVDLGLAQETQKNASEGHDFSKKQKKSELSGLGELRLHKKQADISRICRFFGSKIMITLNDEKRLPSRKQSHIPLWEKEILSSNLTFQGIC